MGDIPWIVTAWLAAPLAGEPPQLDALLEYLMSLHHPKGEAGYKVDRIFPAPPIAALPIPLLRRMLHGWPVACCSNPILPRVAAETVEHIAKRIGVEHAGLLAPGERKIVSTTNAWTKSYRLPLRVRRVQCVRWVALSDNRRELWECLKRVDFLGKKMADGYGRISRWEVEEADGAWHWYAPSEWGTMLMRVLPNGPKLPKDLIGYKKDFASCCPPYWHSDRYCEVVTPC